jgi:hypothetical protein
MWGLITFIFKAVVFVLKWVGSVIAWAALNPIAASLLGASIAVAGFALGSDFLISTGAILGGAALGGWIAGTLGAWFGSDVAARLTSSRLASGLVEAAAVLSIYGWVSKLSGSGSSVFESHPMLMF